MKVFRQGDLDGLCGVYSIVNAARVVSRLDAGEAEVLFHKLMRRVGDARWVTSGFGRGRMDRLLRDGARDVLPYRRSPFRARDQVPLAEFWGEIERFLREPPRAAGAIILCVETPEWSHWTTVVAASDRQLRLVDSDGRKTLERRRCTTGHRSSVRPYRLWPAYSYFLS